MTAPVLDPTFEPTAAAPPGEGREAAVGALAAFLAEAALVGTVALPPYLFAQLLRLGLSRRAVQLATRLATAPLGRRLSGSPHAARMSARVAGTAAAQVADAEPQWRARYLLAAAGRLSRDLGSGVSPPDALRVERRWLGEHRAAGRRRAAAAAAVDVAVERSGSEWLLWRVDPALANTAGCVAADGRVFSRAFPLVFSDDDLPPRPQWPGAVHPRCGCRGVPLAAGVFDRALTVTRAG